MTSSPSGLFMSLGQFALLYTALSVGMPAGLASLVLQAQVGLTVRHRRADPARAAQPGRRSSASRSAPSGSPSWRPAGRATTPLVGLVLVVAAATSWAVGNVAARRAAGRRRSATDAAARHAPDRAASAPACR